MSIASPCKGVCKISQEFKVCAGCYRNRREIAQWNTMNDIEKMLTMKKLEKRQEVYKDIINAI